MSAAPVLRDARVLPVVPLRSPDPRPSGSSPKLPPLALARVAAGFPSPADDYLDRPLDLNEFLIDHPESTFFVRVQGDSMLGAGIHDGDILIVDRSAQAVHGQVVIAALHGELTVKRLLHKDGQLLLSPENPNFQPIPVPPEADFEVWGVARHVIHTLGQPAGRGRRRR